MSVIIKSGASGNLANVDANGNLQVVVNGSVAAGSNIIGQVEITDGINVLGTSANPVIVSSAPPQDIIVTGTISSSPNESVSISAQGHGTIVIYISGSWAGTLQFELSPDGVSWSPAMVFPRPASTSAVSSTTTNGFWVWTAPGVSELRVRASAWSTGTATIHLESNQNVAIVQTFGTLPDNQVQIDSARYMGVLPAEVSSVAPFRTDGALSLLQLDILGNLRTRSRAESILGDIVVIPRLNQLEINFSEGFNPALITNSASGGGSFVQVEGAAEYHAGTALSGQATGISLQQLKYHPGHEWFANFTAAFTTPTDSFNPNYQRIGPYNATDGFYLGYEKTTLSLTQLQNNVANSIPKSSWNGDPCDGSVTSAFTRGGVPEVLNFNNINIYRIRGSWFGTASVQLQVFSPDMEWIVLHTFNFPNSQSLSYTYTTNWNMKIDVFKSGSDATDLHIRCACLVMGTNNETAAISETLNDYSQGSLVRSVLTGKNTQTGDYANVGLSTDDAVTVAGSGAVSINAAVWDSTTPQGTFIMPLHNDFNHNTVTVSLVSTSPISAGAITFEASLDNINFIGLAGVDISTGQSMPSPVVNIVAGSTRVYTFNVTGFDHFRYRLSTAITGAGTVTSSHLVQGLASPNVSTTITTGTINVSSNQGTPNTLNNAWPTELTDGTNGPAAIKAASTPAVATDPALVVAVSPNNTVAVTGTFWQATQPVSGTVAATQATSPWITQDNHFVRTVAQDGSGNLGVNVQNFPASQTVSGSVVVTQPTAASLNATVVGTLTNNNAAPSANNFGVLPAKANAVSPTIVEGNQILLSTDLGGYLRTSSRPAAPTTAKWSHAIIAISATTGVQTLIAAVAGQTIRVMKVQFTTDKSTNFNFLDSTPTTLSGSYILTGNGSSFSDSGDGEPLWIGTSGKSFQINLTGTVTLGGDIWYTQS